MAKKKVNGLSLIFEGRKFYLVLNFLTTKKKKRNKRCKRIAGLARLVTIAVRLSEKAIEYQLVIVRRWMAEIFKMAVIFLINLDDSHFLSFCHQESVS